MSIKKHKSTGFLATTPENQFLLYFTVWTMIYVTAGKQTLLCKPLKTRCRFKCKSLTNALVLSIVPFYQIPPTGIQFNSGRTSTYFACHVYIFVLTASEPSVLAASSQNYHSCQCSCIKLHTCSPWMYFNFSLVSSVVFETIILLLINVNLPPEKKIPFSCSEHRIPFNNL